MTACLPAASVMTWALAWLSGFVLVQVQETAEPSAAPLIEPAERLEQLAAGLRSPPMRNSHICCAVVNIPSGVQITVQVAVDEPAELHQMVADMVWPPGVMPTARRGSIILTFPALEGTCSRAERAQLAQGLLQRALAATHASECEVCVDGRVLRCTRRGAPPTVASCLHALLQER